ncbi:DUF1934 domain-containing protein [Saccharibacillus kuerlensis]|uniref:DUF1934 domain-containing protein n=1 Tax=Saccharibacillus kuerlensis TaxID=459527 RepID=A0ABQ2LBV8_9BACL|nr:DUF1934 domain-containing protein [Saccharibacillus kuerlensis]GGO09781.1 hypothetical protein GCM10010969_40530 [Saccharibacillus kuerlensis]
MQDMSRVLIRIVSRQDEETVEQTLAGQVFQKEKSLYIRYEEPGADGSRESVRTLLKVTEEELKVIRHGEVESEQSFRKGSSLPGFYRSPYTRFAMVAHTRELRVRMQGPTGEIHWEYELEVQDVISGHFAVSLTIQEEVNQHDD